LNLPTNRLFTIGHSNHDFGRLTELLRAAGVTAIADVRTYPASQRYPQFNRAELQERLQEEGIAYAFLGRQLGGRPGNPQLYHGDGSVNYESVQATSEFRKGIERVCAAFEDYAVCLLCSEEDPLDCHRGLMISPILVERKLPPVHLRGDGSIESTAEFEDRLLAATKVGTGILDGMFASTLSDAERQTLLRQAYRFQARRKAFRWRPESAAEPQEE
jgi:uncharacterized protein (DUF488 family)